VQGKAIIKSAQAPSTTPAAAILKTVKWTFEALQRYVTEDGRMSRNFKVVAFPFSQHSLRYKIFQ
jgi:hypothetical protein